MEIQEIRTELLCHHPDNPRSDYGDIEELTASIKSQGILQPLTVVQIGTGRHYSVVAGNRRLEAAKAVGLDSCPCIVSDMSDKEQAAVMLIENMQRRNLTPYEEAKGVQMCLDLGMSEADLCKKTGFSKETIRHRKKLAELDQDVLQKKCQDGQVTLQELISLEKIKDPEKKNKVLEYAGTNNFNYQLTAAIDKEKALEEKEKVYDLLLGFAEEMPADWHDNTYYQISYHVPVDFEAPEDTEETDYAFKETWSGADYFALYRKRPVAEAEEEDDEETESTRSAYDLQHEAKAKLGELGKRFFEMRKDFMRRSTDKFKGDVMKWLAYLLILDDYGDEDPESDDILTAEGFPWVESVFTHQYLEIYREVMGTENTAGIIRDMRGENTDYPVASLALIYSFLETGNSIGCANWRGEYNKEDDTYPRLYEFLRQCGYKLSDEEEQILDGTHEYYYEEKD